VTNTFARLSAILIKDCKLQPARLTFTAPLESLGIDSLGTVELLWNIEGAFQIPLPPDPVGLPTLGDVVRYVDELSAIQGAVPARAAHGSLMGRHNAAAAWIGIEHGPHGPTMSRSTACSSSLD